ncbi:MAG: substrate-binding domain-containing protein [Candidatus Hydrothermarchaeales archaeon]
MIDSRHLLLLLLLVAGCISQGPQQPQPKQRDELTLATTTSAYDSGLLSVLLPPFEEKYNCKVKVIAQGTGAALRKAELGGADIVIVHAPAAEEKFVSDGYGINRRRIMHNDFVIVGPTADPAGIKGLEDAAYALKKIAESRAAFFSRGDNSGTHKKEKTLWKKTGIEPEGRWYRQTGVGMGATIIITDQVGGYTLTDRSTFLTMREKIALHILVEGDPLLLNPYSAIAVNPAKHPEINYQLAMAFIGYLTSPQGQKIILEFGREKYGEDLFHPDAILMEALE